MPEPLDPRAVEIRKKIEALAVHFVAICKTEASILSVPDDEFTRLVVTHLFGTICEQRQVEGGSADTGKAGRKVG